MMYDDGENLSKKNIQVYREYNIIHYYNINASQK